MKTNFHNREKAAGVIFKKDFKRFLTYIGPRVPACVFVLLLLSFSFWLMFHTFSYDGNTHEIGIAYKLWSDFGAHIPLIRSFSLGDNFPVQYPIFPGEPIRYHFLFYLFVGLLEKAGMRIDWALNVPSALSLFSLLLLIFLLTKKLFSSLGVAALAVVFFLFNGSLGFLRFFTLHPLSSQTLDDILDVREFPAFAPWGQGEVTAFWNLNIYTNQRHLALAFACVLLFLLTFLRMKKLHWKQQILRAVPWGILFGAFPYFHQPTLLIVAVILICYFFLYPSGRLFIFSVAAVTAAIAVPQIFLTQGGVNAVRWYPGYIIHNEILGDGGFLPALWHMVRFWWQNLGLHGVLILIGFFLIPAPARIALLPVIPLFIIPNLFKFSVEASANHKFFNFVMILGAMISAYVLVRSYRAVRRHFRNWFIRCLLLIVYCLLFIVLTLSGIIDFFVILNDARGGVVDIPKNETAAWIAANTPKNAVFLNSRYLYHPASLAGRPIFLGWPYFPWSAGYRENRMPVMKTMYETGDDKVRCDLLHKYNISYITVENVKNDINLPAIDLQYFLKKYTPIFIRSDKQYAIFETQVFCRKTP
jgi:hypothetical protein